MSGTLVHQWGGGADDDYDVTMKRRMTMSEDGSGGQDLSVRVEGGLIALHELLTLN